MRRARWRRRQCTRRRVDAARYDSDRSIARYIDTTYVCLFILLARDNQRRSGDVFGEISFLMGGGASATIIAASDTTTLTFVERTQLQAQQYHFAIIFSFDLLLSFLVCARKLLMCRWFSNHARRAQKMFDAHPTLAGAFVCVFATTRCLFRFSTNVVRVA
jgi:CRP-like cAMP-binding protein